MITTSDILAGIDEELSKLHQVRALLAGEGGRFPEPLGNRPRKKHRMTAEGRARIAEAQKRRWAKQKKVA